MGDNLVNHLDATRGADTAGSTFAAALNGAELHGETCLFGEVHCIVEDHDSSVPEHAFLRGEGFVVERRIEQRFRKIRAERSPYLYRPHGAPGKCAAAKIVNRLP